MFVIKKTHFHFVAFDCCLMVTHLLRAYFFVSLCPRLSFSVSVLSVCFSLALSKCKMRARPRQVTLLM